MTIPGKFTAELAKKRLADLQRKSIAKIDPNEKLEDFIVRIHPEYERPMHLGKALEQFNAVKNRPVRLLLSVPPRHGKSESVMHLVVQMLLRFPKYRVAYVSYADQFSWEQSAKIQKYAIDAGVELDPRATSTRHWQTMSGGSVSAMGIGGGLTGKGFDLVIIDDPHKNRAETESQIIRDKVYNGYVSDIRSRLEPGASLIVIHTRWSTDDLIGRLEKEPAEGWIRVNIPAVDPISGAALWPSRFPIDELNKLRAPNEYNWWSLYMGQPRSRGCSVFQEPQYYEELPKTRSIASAIGLDLAYTAKTQSDWSVAVSGILFGDTLYVTDLRRKQVEPTAFANEIKDLRSKHPGSRICWFVGGIEKGIVSMLRQFGVVIDAINAKEDKFVRAQPVASAWNSGKVLLPANAPWLSDFLDEVCTFTGVSDAHDDIVDALSALHHPLLAKRLPRAAGQVRLTPF